MTPVATRLCSVLIIGLFHNDGAIAAVNRLRLYALIEQDYHVDSLTLGER
jgi:hypothetical protein